MIKKTNFRKKESGLVINTADPIVDISGKGLSMIKCHFSPFLSFKSRSNHHVQAASGLSVDAGCLYKKGLDITSIVNTMYI